MWIDVSELVKKKKKKYEYVHVFCECSPKDDPSRGGF